jgi:demethylmenaquinone methyltransferase/2-methoxy-6-polyprenyl-1,4-benzoquinol methylase
VANPFYQRGAERADRVRTLFATIARRYDLINDVQSLGLHRLWKQRLARLAHVGPGRRALDVCCGTGDVVFALASSGADVVGLDFSPEMLAVARERLERRPFSGSAAATNHITFVEGDALHLPFPDAAFDAVTIAYGLRNLADLAGGLAELSRVLRPGGRLVTLDFGKPVNPVWRALYFTYLRMAVPVFGWWFAGSADAYAYILESLRHYPDPGELSSLLRRQGLEAVTLASLLGGAMVLHTASRPRGQSMVL